MLKHTSLYQDHIAAKARMVPFAGYEMPVQYKGLMVEHHAVRHAAGLFDVSHMGEFLVSGPKARSFLNFVTTNDIEKLKTGSCQYNLLCYENGTVVDDIIVSQLSEDRYLIVVNAANIAKDFAWLGKHQSDGVVLQDLSEKFSLIALQGPQSAAILKKCGFELTNLKTYHFTIVNGQIKDYLLQAKIPQQEIFVSRTGYTGEDGFEILVPNAEARVLWQKLMGAGQEFGLEPAGLGARDTLRLEVAFSLYGHEINDEILALEAGLGWVVKLDKSDFIGKAALQNAQAAGLKRRVMGLELIEAGVAREGYVVNSMTDEVLGIVTSGTHSPTLKKPIALALVGSTCKIGDQAWVDIRGKRKKAVFVKKPFYKRGG